MIEKRLLRVDEVAVMLSCHRNTVYNLIRDGFLTAHSRFPNMKGMRILSESVEIYIKTHQAKPEDLNF